MPKDNSGFLTARGSPTDPACRYPTFHPGCLQLHEHAGCAQQQQKARQPTVATIPAAGILRGNSKAWITCAPFCPTSPALEQRSHPAQPRHRRSSPQPRWPAPGWASSKKKQGIEGQGCACWMRDDPPQADSDLIRTILRTTYPVCRGMFRAAHKFPWFFR